MLDDMDKLVSLCKRRGFIFPSSEVYGGINGFWDYGPLGVELKRNIKDAWWRDNVRMRDDMVGLDCSIIMNPRVWEASGHIGGFSDPMVNCARPRSGTAPTRSSCSPTSSRRSTIRASRPRPGWPAWEGRPKKPPSTSRRGPPSWPNGSASRWIPRRSSPTCSSPSATARR